MIELRTPTPDDINRHTQWAASPDVLPLDPRAGAAEMPLFWSIYCDNIHIGTISVYNRVGLSGEVGVLIGEKANWDRGYGTEAVGMLLDICKGAGFEEIYLKVLPFNTRAIRCYEKCGFSGTGYIFLDGKTFLQMTIDLRQKGEQ